MIRPVFWASLAIAACYSTSAAALELNYKWKKGDKHKFHYEEKTDFKMNMGPMGGMTSHLEVRSDFTQKVLKVKPNGAAIIQLTVDKIDIYQEGNKLGTFSDLPKSARTVKAEVDRKGRAKFFKMVTVYIHEDEVYVGIHDAKAGPHGVSAKTSAGGPEGGVEVEIYASIDPKTGAVTGGAKYKETKAKKKKKAVQVKKEDPAVDVLPKQIFELMVLPEGSMTPGTKQEVKTPIGGVAVTMEKLKKKKATIRFVMKGDMDVPTGEPAAPEGAGMPDMGAMMGGMMGGGAPGAGPSAAAVKVTIDGTSVFDVKKGRLISLTGDIDTEMSFGGMGKMTTKSKLKLNRR